MLTGASNVYRPTDTLLVVAVKYADGDEQWGDNVAAQLGIHPHATLAELAISPLAFFRAGGPGVAVR